MPMDPANPLVLHASVDYAEGPAAAWWPRGESPILAGLVQRGRLPPVHERVGPEPVVMRGVDGIGRYGGTWMRVANSAGDVSVIGWRLSYAGLVRWSPHGYPIVPHLARSVTPRDGYREFLIELRRGARWSDGHPFTADDVLYWWEAESLDTAVGSGRAPNWMFIAGQPGTIEKLDDFTLVIRFPEPYGLFLEMLAVSSHHMANSPAHYLRPRHPIHGDQDLIRAEMALYGLPSARALYAFCKQWEHPDHPRMWPWVYRRHRPSPPQIFVRNPYYFAVDELGNQLPYVDRIQFEVQTDRLIPLSAASGQITMQTRSIRYADHVELMSRRTSGNYRVLHWYPATRSDWVINPNLNRLIRADDPSTKWKAELLADRRFRQAMSLAIDRPAICRAVYNSQVRPAQVTPGDRSPFHSERLASAFIQHDPAQAERILDRLNLIRGPDGYRRFPDGSPMVFFLDYTPFTGQGPAQFIADDWASVGVRTVIREQARQLFYTRKAVGDFDFNVWSSESDFYPLVSPRYFVPVEGDAFYAVNWARWFTLGGYYNDPRVSLVKSAVRPPENHPIWEAFHALHAARSLPGIEDQVRAFQPALDAAADNTWTIGIAQAPPQLVIVRNDFRNVPDVALFSANQFTPGNAGIETYYFENPADSPGAIQQISLDIERITPRTAAARATAPDQPADLLTLVARYALLAILAAIILMAALRHPFVLRRIFIMVPTLLVISIIVFTIIQLPPGDFLTSRLIELQETGDEAALRQIEDLRTLFHFDEPHWKRYLRWMGCYWFVSFSPADEGLLQGNLGRSMESSLPVGQIVGDRILLTMAISAGTILFTWALAIPIGVFSAVRQYSLADYALTLLAFIGMSVPGFLLALVLMAMTDISGLFSPQFAAQPEWDWPKFFDLLAHVWVPVVVLGIGGTAGMIRVMRANLLDELRKPYVTTARAKGVRPVRLLIKYPLRIALNPFVSGIGHLFPQLVSGGAIVAMVLSLPTVGPLLLDALFNEDMILAGSMLMVLSLLGVAGTLVSDLLLLWLDPRIRYERS